MSGWEDELVDPFLAEVLSDEEGREREGRTRAARAQPEGDGAPSERPSTHLEGVVSVLEDSLATIAPAPSLRDALLSAARVEGRFDRFAPVVAELLDVSEARAIELLDGIAREDVWAGSPVPGVRLYHIEGGPKVAGAITGFVHMHAGTVFPEHRHLGDEAVLVVQGSFEDGVTGQVHRAGEVVRMPASSAHDFRARPGPALVYMVVLEQGLQIGDAVIGPDDPGM